MRYTLYGSLENDIDILYTKNNTKYGFISVTLDKTVKSNFFEKSIANKTRAQAVIFRKSFLSQEFTRLLTRGTTVLLKGELIKTPSFEKPASQFSSKDIKALKSDCLLLIDDTSSIFMLSMPEGKERRNLELYKANAMNFYQTQAKLQPQQIKQPREHYETQNS
jgi:hypothetical protein